MLEKIAVVGAGISGLACAFELQKEGFDVVVYEKNKYPGGRMATRTKHEFPFDIGADHLCDLYDSMKEYCAIFGIGWKKMRFLNYQLFKDGKLIDLNKSISLLSKIRLANQYRKIPDVGSFFNLTELAEYDDSQSNAYEFIKKEVGSDVADYLVDSFVSTYQFHRASEASNSALLGIMRSIKKDGKKWDLHRLEGGMSALPNAFAERLRMKLGTPVESIKVSGNKIAVGTKDGQEEYDAVVIGATANVANTILQNKTAAQRDLLENTQYASSISVSFKVTNGAMGKIAICWVPYAESQMISGYVNQDMKNDAPTKDDKQLVNCWLHEEFAESIIEKTDQEIYSLVKEELKRVSPWFKPGTHLLEPYDIQRWYQAEPKFIPGHISRVKNFLENNQGDNNIFLTGDYLNSPWAEGALRCGKRVAEQVNERLFTNRQAA